MDKIKQGIAKLKCGNSEGTAFLISDTIALTVSHCILEAIADEKEIFLTFYNVPKKETIIVKATQISNVINYPVTALKLETGVHTEYLNLACYEDHLERGEQLLSFGYPKIKGDEGYPIDIYINDFINENVANDADISLKLDAGDRMSDYSGMSGSPVIYRKQVIGLLIEESMESIGNSGRAVDLKAISNKSITGLLDNLKISYIPSKYIELKNDIKKYQQPKEYQENRNGYDDRQMSLKEKFVIGYTECDGAIGDYEKAIESELTSICNIKNKGNKKIAWIQLLELTNRVRISKSKPIKMLARLYYTRAIWYLDDDEDRGNAQKYIQKVLDIDPDYDCRTYYAKKHYLEGNIIHIKNSLLPINNVSILNTYLQICIYQKEIEDALEAYESGKKLANESTFYLMSLICILDGDYELANEYLSKADENGKDISLHVMMHGVVLYWKLLYENKVCGDCLLPSLYTKTMILINTEKARKIETIVELYKRALTLAEIAENIDLQKQILVVWLNTLSISDQYREDGYKIARKLLDLEEYQCQAVIYLYIMGYEVPLKKAFEPKCIVKVKGNNIESIIACIYITLSKKDETLAYHQLKEYKFKFEETHMMEYWFELVIYCCKNKEDLKKLQEDLDRYQMDKAVKSRLNGMFLEALGEGQLLFEYAESLYLETKEEIDLLNLINSCEKISKWEKVEQYSLEWDEKFQNPLAKVKVIKSLALQNKQEKCLDKICNIRNLGEEECLTNEVLFYEVQALKISGRFDEAITKGNILWHEINSKQVLFLLAECYFLNIQDQEAIYILRDGISKGIKSVEVYQLLAEYNRRVNIKEVEKYVQKACIVSDNDPHIMMWAMQLLYSIGKSEKASEIMVKLQTMDQANCFRAISFKEAKDWIDQVQKENEKQYNMYMKCQFPYHVFIDNAGTASYALFCTQLWESNIESDVRKQLLYINFGGHKAESEILRDSLDNSAILDFSSLVHLKHFDLLNDIQKCWKKIYISGNINNIFVSEQNNCLPNQPDMLKENKNIMDSWRAKNLHYLQLPSQDIISQWVKTGIEPGDVIPYELARSNGAFYISDHLLSDLMEESYKIPTQMRSSVISTNELFIALERRGDISSALKNRLGVQKQTEYRSEIIDLLVSYNGKLPIYVDENFLREIYKMEAIGPVSQKCELFVIDNIFHSTIEELKRVEQGKNALALLELLKSDIQEYKEQKFIQYCCNYQDENKKDRGIFTNDFIDLIHCSSEKNNVLICDDRWVNSYNNFGECYIYNSIDVLELLHEQKIITDEKYVKVITQMFSEGYAYIIPPLEYMKILLWQIKDGNNFIEEIPEELSVMCNYLVYITASQSCLNDEMIHEGALPESAGYIYNLQRILLKLMKEVWCSDRSELWKRQASNWLLANFSVFTYKSLMNESKIKNNRNYFELELGNFIFSGFCEIPANSFRKEYYNWLFNWLSRNVQWKNGLEKKTIQWLAEIINDVYKHEDGVLYKDIGIGALVLSVTADMPEYYKNVIRENKTIKQIIERFEDCYVLMGTNEFVSRKQFNQWIEDSMKHGIGNSIIRMNETSKREYTITFIVDILFHQGFKIEFNENTVGKQTYYFRIDKAMLLSEDELLRTKGLFSLSELISDQDIKQYQEYIKRKTWTSIVKGIVTEAKLNKAYIFCIIKFILENEEKLFSIEELFPHNINYLKEIVYSITEDDIMLKLDSWSQKENKNYGKIFVQLIIYIYNYLKIHENYLIIDENDKMKIAHYFADKVLIQIDYSITSFRSKYSLEDISNYLVQLNDSMGYLDNFKKNKTISIEEVKDITDKVVGFFNVNSSLQWSGSEVVDICKKLFYINNENMMIYIQKIKKWIEAQWKVKEKRTEKELLQVMEYVAILTEKEDKMVNSYLDLWDEILAKGFHIEISMQSIYMLRSYIMFIDFEQGIRMRKIIEDISLQK